MFWLQCSEQGKFFKTEYLKWNIDGRAKIDLYTKTLTPAEIGKIIAW
jgi:hypothetical protein